MPTTYALVSGKGGAGKTTAAINLSTSLHDFGHDVTLVDANFENPNVGLYLDLPDFPIALQHVLNENVNILHTVRVHHTGLKIIPSSITSSHKKTDLRQLGKHLQELNSTVLVDSLPGVSRDAQQIIKAADKLIAVTTPDVPHVLSTVRLIKAAHELDKPVLGLILNRVKGDSFELSSREIEGMCEAPILARIPEDDEVRKAAFDGNPVVRYNPYAKSTVEYNYLAAKLLNKKYSLPNMLSLKRLLKA